MNIVVYIDLRMYVIKLKQFINLKHDESRDLYSEQRVALKRYSLILVVFL